jgi:hypothetical protein
MIAMRDPAVVSLVMSGIAVAVAFLHGQRAVSLARSANEIPVATSVYAEFRSERFREHFKAVLALDTPGSVPVDGGFAALGKAKDSAYAVCYHFEYIGLLVAFKHFSEDVALGTMSTQLLLAWQALEPFIDSERRHRDAHYPPGVGRRFLPYYEHLIARILQRRRSDGVVPVSGIKLQRLDRPLRDQRPGLQEPSIP